MKVPINLAKAASLSLDGPFNGRFAVGARRPSAEGDSVSTGVIFCGATPPSVEALSHTPNLSSLRESPSSHVADTPFRVSSSALVLKMVIGSSEDLFSTVCSAPRAEVFWWSIAKKGNAYRIILISMVAKP